MDDGRLKKISGEYRVKQPRRGVFFPAPTHSWHRKPLQTAPAHCVRGAALFYWLFYLIFCAKYQIEYSFTYVYWAYYKFQVIINLMTKFSEKVYSVVSKIPKGKTLTYKQVARLAGRPKAYRAVGNILNKNTSSKIPCHRVIRSDGKIGGYRWGSQKKKEILKKEKVI